MNDQKSFQGFILINKPAGITSAQALNRLKRVLPKKIKVGHAGTLDTFATGLLVVGITRPATRLLRYMSLSDKQYQATGLFGLLTDTLDKRGNIIMQKDAISFSFQQISETLSIFKNGYKQIPPVYSALKYQGERLSDYARAGKLTEEMQKIVAQKSRDITLHKLEVVSVKESFFSINAHVSHGTYIRSLIYDIAQALGSYATTMSLQRTAIGPFSLDDAIKISDLTKDTVKNVIISIDEIIKKINPPK